MSNLKQLVFDKCVAVADEKIAQLNNALLELTKGAENESKSSAGDKHETSRAMIQLEQEKLGKQLAELENQQQTLQKINPKTESATIMQGSLVKTDKGFLFIACPLGKISVNGENIMVVSPQSPIGVRLIGRNINDTISINNINYQVNEIW